jgi:hypothetical protein
VTGPLALGATIQPVFISAKIPSFFFDKFRLKLLELALSSKGANKGGEQWRQQGYVLGGNSSVNLASHGHCAGVFIGVRVPGALY